MSKRKPGDEEYLTHEVKEAIVGAIVKSGIEEVPDIIKVVIPKQVKRQNQQNGAARCSWIILTNFSMRCQMCYSQSLIVCVKDK